MTSENKPKDELDRLMSEGGHKAQDIIQNLSGVAGAAQQIVDLSNAGREVIKHPLPGSVDWESAIDSWQRTNYQADHLLRGIQTLSIAAFTSTASGTNFAMTQFTALPSQPPSLLPPQQEATFMPQRNLRFVIDQSIKRDELLALMRQFGLAKAYPGKKSPIELFEIAWASYERPVLASSPVSTSLIPMREAIESTLQELLRRRPVEEAAKNQRSKILSIGRQLAHAGITEEDTQTWANNWERLVDELSDAKQGNYSRDEWRDVLRRAILFLQELLQGIDPAKFR
jgi:hypothetical protein